MAVEGGSCLVVEHYARTPHQDALLGITPSTNSTVGGVLVNCIILH